MMVMACWPTLCGSSMKEHLVWLQTFWHVFTPHGYFWQPLALSSSLDAYVQPRSGAGHRTTGQHACVLQDLFWSFGHAVPPKLGRVLTLNFLVCVPPPHFLSQAPHAP